MPRSVMVNKNIIETIIQKVTHYPLYLLEYCYNDIDFNSKFPAAYLFNIDTSHGIYESKEDLQTAIDSIISDNLEPLIYIRIRTIKQVGSMKDHKTEEYMYFNGYKYERIFEDLKLWGHIDKYVKSYEYKKIE